MDLSKCAFLLLSFLITLKMTRAHEKRALLKSYEKPPEEILYNTFFGEKLPFDYTESLVNLLLLITNSLNECTPVFLYDKTVDISFFGRLFKDLSIPYVHGYTGGSNESMKHLAQTTDNKCVSYVLFVEDIMKSRDIIGPQNYHKVVIIVKSSQWKVYDFLESEIGQSFMNVLVIAKSISRFEDEYERELPYVLYTHNLCIDSTGSSTHQVLASWVNGSLTRPDLDFFPKKMKNGFSTHRFTIAIAEQPPFTIKKKDYDEMEWDGIEPRLLKLLGETYNFTVEYREAANIKQLGSAKSVIAELKNNKADIGIGGLYIVSDVLNNIDISQGHSQDCAAFISLASTALPRWRAIMGPFQWTVWLALTLTYLFAIFPLAFSDRHSLKYLLETPEEMENMFWYVFGTFTNCFAFGGSKSWGKSDKAATRILIGFYWIFTIIVTACYTGSIIAFVTLPVFPETVDTVTQLLSGHYQIGTLDKGGWEYWFLNSSDPATTKLLRNVQYVPDIESGIKNTTSAFFWSYAFLGSKAHLDYLVRLNFTTSSKRGVLHISTECFVPYSVAFAFIDDSIFSDILNVGIQRAIEGGLIKKLDSDVRWTFMRSATGKLLQANNVGSSKLLSTEDRALALDDTQGMFLLLGFGYLIGATSLLSEWLGGCFHLCKRKIRRFSTAVSLMSNRRTYDIPTPREKRDSIQYGVSKVVFDGEHEDQESVDITIKTIEAEIDRAFNFEEIFGEQSSYHSEIQEELKDTRSTDG
ncbi:hypothetical protein FQA39_LY13521 [Lamprigera yunnana]|nr:hypothetical protein FQA39_LY13521 [Lamprigera yunnana]